MATNSYQTCQELIWLSETSNTYCMRKKGHTGKHSVQPEPPEEMKEKTKPKKPLPSLENFGPYAKDDPRAKRGY